MKKILGIAFAIVIIAGAAYSAPVNVGVVDMAKVSEGYERYSSARKDLEKKKAELQSIVDQEEQSILQLKKSKNLNKNYFEDSYNNDITQINNIVNVNNSNRGSKIISYNDTPSKDKGDKGIKGDKGFKNNDKIKLSISSKNQSGNKSSEKQLIDTNEKSSPIKVNLYNKVFNNEDEHMSFRSGEKSFKSNDQSNNQSNEKSFKSNEKSKENSFKSKISSNSKKLLLPIQPTQPILTHNEINNNEIFNSNLVSNNTKFELNININLNNDKLVSSNNKSNNKSNRSINNNSNRKSKEKGKITDEGSNTDNDIEEIQEAKQTNDSRLDKISIKSNKSIHSNHVQKEAVKSLIDQLFSNFGGDDNDSNLINNISICSERKPERNKDFNEFNYIEVNNNINQSSKKIMSNRNNNKHSNKNLNEKD